MDCGFTRNDTVSFRIEENHAMWIYSQISPDPRANPLQAWSSGRVCMPTTRIDFASGYFLNELLNHLIPFHRESGQHIFQPWPGGFWRAWVEKNNICKLFAVPA